MKTRKILAMLCVASLSVSLFAGCGYKTEEKEETAAKTEENKENKEDTEDTQDKKEETTDSEGNEEEVVEEESVVSDFTDGKREGDTFPVFQELRYP